MWRFQPWPPKYQRRGPQRCPIKSIDTIPELDTPRPGVRSSYENVDFALENYDMDPLADTAPSQDMFARRRSMDRILPSSQFQEGGADEREILADEAEWADRVPQK
jgi:hypothetical protein